jgi:phenylacetate-CoA ligase
LLVSSFQLTAANLPRIHAELRRFRPVVMEGWPSSLTILAGLLRDAGERLPVKAIITSSESMTHYQQDLLREVFGGPIIDHYGQTERVAMAGTCEASGYHVFPDYGVVELAPVSDESWEIIATPLHNWGFPIFRYRTGDTVGPAPPGPCPCRRSFPLLGTIDGRVEDAFTAADGRPIPLPHALVKNLTGLREVQVAQHGPGRFEIRMVPGVGFDPDATRRLATRNVERLIGPGQVLTFALMESIPRSAGGKLRTTLILNDLER